MLKFRNTPATDVRLARALGVLFGSAALVALVSATPVTSAFAQGGGGSAPAGLLRLDPPQPANDAANLTEEQRAKVRGTYARARKTQVSH